MTLQKAKLRNEDDNSVVQVLFNPTEYTLDKANDWGVDQVKKGHTKGVTGQNVPKLNFKNGHPQTLTMELFLDVLEQSNADVRDHVNKLMAFMKVDPGRKNATTGASRPPLCRFEWGGDWHFLAAMTKLTVKYTLFREDGIPVRATANITLEEVEDEAQQKKQNPTSYSEPGRKRREVRPQDTLATIAYEEYGDATKWRAIADDNHIDDPLSLRPGQVLSIPARSSRRG